MRLAEQHPGEDIIASCKVAEEEAQPLFDTCYLRRATPLWTMLAEVWRMSMFPMHCFRQSGVGMRCSEINITAPNVHKTIAATLGLVRAWIAPRLQWTQSLAVEATHTMPLLCPLGQGWMQLALRRRPQIDPTALEHGVEARRSRDSPIVTQAMLEERLAKMGLHVLSSLKHLVKAFRCVAREALEEASLSLYTQRGT